MSSTVGIQNPTFCAAQVGPAKSLMRERYDADGYVTVKRVFDPAILALLLRSLQHPVEEEGRTDSSQSLTEDLVSDCEMPSPPPVSNAIQSVGSSPAAYELLGSSKIFEIVSMITGFDHADLDVMPPYLMVQCASDDRSDSTWLLDGSFSAWCQNFLTLWFPVSCGTNRDTSTIRVIPGSHRYDPQEKDIFLRYGVFRQLPSELGASGETRERTIDLELGDCCILNSNTVSRMVADRSGRTPIVGVVHVANRAEYQAGGSLMSPEFTGGLE